MARQQAAGLYIGLTYGYRRSRVYLQVTPGLRAGLALPLALLVICWVSAAQGKATTVSIAKFLGRSDAAVRLHHSSEISEGMAPTALTWRCMTCQGVQLCALPWQAETRLNPVCSPVHTLLKSY
jgi:hypothetical protein